MWRGVALQGDMPTFEVGLHNQQFLCYQRARRSRSTLHLPRVLAAANLAYRFRFSLIAPSDHCYIVIGSVAF